ncbi:MAG: cbb3-type cytochrome c oxidase subunit I [Thermoflexales bacterium]|nr:cbb3-type cytochrome c oxidase subunit I [Thermoflexales bacterium]MCS7324001.1 cbb3-type cytochrome c oxidase subunit I [Thermoflexales bacterium]MDW8052941.1 cbb3-type cytochrome c oxidase subunit I [Anaerolineae bacterium]MDW8291592.1 cbb3-type cytochrome c oxidase subunit I [Anaerolineae bacterium]
MASISLTQIEMPASPRTLKLVKRERLLVGAHILTAFFALMIGIFMGPFQAFHRSPTFVQYFPTIPVFSYYYQAVTAHGVMNALFFTTFFIIGFMYFVTERSLQRPLRFQQAAWVAYALMFVGLATMLAVLLLEPQRSAVLYTFYPPMIAPAPFYLGLVLLVLGSWIASAILFFTYRDWKREHQNERVPLAVFIMLVTFIMWDVATIGVAIEILFMLLPASLGLLRTVDPQLGRTLFWFFGHPLVYFWLLPAYVSWYTMLPKQAGGRLFSEPLARVAFIMFLLFSVPVGVHHQFSDPGISASSKGLQAFLTLVVSIPSFMTAFNVGAALESAGRNNGAKGLIDWVWKQRWSDPVVAAQLFGMLNFIAGGFSGIINASSQLNATVHNTSWVPAHFHQTLGSAVTLTYISVLYWMLPAIRGRALFSKRMAVAQSVTWFIGMTLFGLAMGEAGLQGAPRRSITSTAPYVTESMRFWLDLTAVSGVILLISAILLYVNIFGTLFLSKQPAPEGEVPITTKSADTTSPLWFERWGIWLGVLALLLLMAYGPVFAETLDFQYGWNIQRYVPSSNAPMP